MPREQNGYMFSNIRDLILLRLHECKKTLEAEVSTVEEWQSAASRAQELCTILCLTSKTRSQARYWHEQSELMTGFQTRR